MASNDRLHPLVVHGGIVAGLWIGVPGPVWALYGGGASIYYLGRSASRILRSGRTHPWYGTTRTLVLAAGLSVASAIACVAAAGATSGGGYGTSEHEMIYAGVVLTAMLFPVWLVVVLLLHLPLIFWRWRRRRVEHREYLRGQEAAQREAAARRGQEQQTAKVQAGHQRRRTEARARCELAYSLHASDISERFPKSMFDAFLQTYMNDSHDAEDVERRGRELQAIIEQHRSKAKPERKPRTIQDLAEWYLREKHRIDSLPLDDELKQEHMAALDMRYAELTQEVLQSMEP